MWWCAWLRFCDNVCCNVSTIRLWEMHIPLAIPMLSALQVVLFYSVDTVTIYGSRVPLGAPRDVLALATVVLAHVDEAHLYGNLIVQLGLGVPLEAAHGTWRTMLVYWVAGVGASAAFVVGYVGSAPVNLVGSSGACFALVGAYVAHLLLGWNETPGRVAWLAIVLFLLYAEMSIVLTNPRPGVAHTSHLAGALLGGVFGMVALVNLRVLWWEPTVRVWAAGLSVALGAWLLAATVTATFYSYVR